MRVVEAVEEHKVNTGGRQAAEALVRLPGGLFVMGLAVAALIAVIVNVLAVPGPLRRDLLVKETVPPALVRGDGLLDPPSMSYGFNDPEKAADGSTRRWTTSHARLNFPYAANIGRQMEFMVRLAGLREAGQQTANVKILMNGKQVATFNAANSFEERTVRLDTGQTPNPYLHPADVQVDIESSTVVGADSKARGVAVEWAELRPARTRSEIAVEAAVWGIFAGLTLALAASRLGLLWGLIYGLASVVSFVAVHMTYVPRDIPSWVEAGLVGLAWLLAVRLASKARPWVGALIAVAGLWLALGGRALLDWEVDDAYISYRYAWNLVHGNGLVYNPGEVVEGYTNFLWTMLAAGALVLGLAPGSVALATTIACSIVVAGLTYRLALRLTNGQEGWALLALGLLVVDASFITYGPKGSGLETMAFALLVLLPIALLWDHEGRAANGQWQRPAAGFVLALSALTRPEGLMVAGLLLGIRCWQDRRAGNPSGRLLLLAGVPFLAVVLPFEVWRISFYGYPFPNTFYTKTGTSLEQFGRGAEYALQFAADHWLVVALALLGVGLALASWVRGRRAGKDASPESRGSEHTGADLLWTMMALVSVFTLYIVAEGGDWATGGRFFVPLAAPITLIAVEAGMSMLALLSGNPRARQLGASALAVAIAAYGAYAFMLQQPDADIPTRTIKDTYKFNKWSLAGLWLRDHTPPGTLAAATPAGGFAYYSQRPVVDMFGLNDLHIGHLKVEHMGLKQAGHEKADPVYVLDRKPEYMMKYDQNIGYFEPVEQRLNSEYETVGVSTATGYEMAMLRRR